MQPEKSEHVGTPKKTAGFSQVAQHVRTCSDIYRGIDSSGSHAGHVPDTKTILKIAITLGPDVIEQLHRLVVEIAKRARVTHGRRFRIDTTVVETNVHYPTDSSLLRTASAC